MNMKSTAFYITALGLSVFTACKEPEKKPEEKKKFV
jgi:hypothetical protein